MWSTFFGVRVESAEDKCMDESFQVFSFYPGCILSLAAESQVWVGEVEKHSDNYAWVRQLLCVEELRGQEEANKQNTNKSQTRMSSRCRQHNQTQKARFTFRQQSRKTDVKLPKHASNSNATNYGNALKTYCTCTNIYTHIHRTYIPVCVNIARHTTVQIFWGGGKQSSSAAAEGFSHKHTFKKKKEKQQKLIK